MLENGLKESACVSSRKLLSSNLTPLSVGSYEESYLEVRYTDTKSLKHDAEETNCRNTKPVFCNAEADNTADPVNHGTDGNTSDKHNKKDINPGAEWLHAAASPPGGDGMLSTKVDHVITQQVQRSRNLSDPHERVIAPAAGKVQRRTMSEGGLPDFGIATPQMEELLEHDECFSWDGADALHLEIVDDEPTECAVANHLGNKQKELQPTASNLNTSNNSSGLGSDDLPVDIPGVHSPKRLNSVPGSEPGLPPQTVGDRSAGDHKMETGDVLSSPSLMITGRAAIIRNKLSLAVHGMSRDDQVVELDDLSPPSPVSLESDGQGFPLAIFTKVSWSTGDIRERFETVFPLNAVTIVQH